MRHTLRKYLSNRGSALFMVISTMTALMISCMAMYFSVVSSRSTQYAIFNQQQSYQSATSLSDAIIASLVTGKGDFVEIGNKIKDLDVGGELSTGSNGFAAFDASGSGKEEESQVGAYMLDAKRLDDITRPDGSTERMYDIVVTVSVNGVKEVYHNIVSFELLEETKSPARPQSKVFAATGYAPNDVFLDGGWFTSDVYYDNELTFINVYGGKAMTVKGNVYASGSLTIKGKGLVIDPEDKANFCVRDTFTAYTNTFIEFDATKRGNVMIGGDCIVSNGGGIFKNADVYILGDLIVDKSYPFGNNCTYFVKGDIILKNGCWADLSNVYCDGNPDNSNNAGGGISGAIAGKWADGATGTTGNGYMTVDEMIDHLDYRTTSTPQYKWEVDTSGLPEKSFHYNLDPAMGELVYTHYLEFNEAKTKNGCIITDLTMNYNNSGGRMTLVIDTGDDPDNVYTIGLKPNRVMDGDASGKKTVFSWFPRDIAKGIESCEDTSRNATFKVLVMGRGSVVIDIPEGVTYQDDTYMSMMHYGWYAMYGGVERYYGTAGATDKEYRITHTEYQHKNNGTKPVYPEDKNFFDPFVHTFCQEGDGCVYTEIKTEECAGCGNELYEVFCDDHGTVDVYCKTCDDPLRANHAGKCANRKDTKAIDSFLNANPAIKNKLLDSSGKVIYPHTSIFLVSCDENADIRFSQRANADPNATPVMIEENTFFGFIYAPYITYKSQIGTGKDTGGIRLFGGMIVSDYIIDASYTYVSCFPDKMPEDLMDEDSIKEQLPSITDKSWKIALRAR